MKVNITQVPGEPAQYNGWTGEKLLALVTSQAAEIERLEAELSDKKAMLENQFKAVDILNAEIERLKGICDKRLMHIMNVCHPLITELADVLESYGFDELLDLIQRARAATPIRTVC